MTGTRARPLGVTIIAIVVIINGVAQVLAAMNYLKWLSLFDLPATGDPTISGWTYLIVGIINIVVGVAMFSLKRWAWMLAILAMGLAVLSAGWSLIQHGFDGITSAPVLTGVISLLILLYLLSQNVRDAFEA